MLAALELNCVFAPWNPKTVWNDSEVKHLLGMLGPSVVVVGDVD